MNHHCKQPIPRNQRGSAMLAAMCFAMVFAISLASYVALCYTSLGTSTRNVAESHCQELAEAGMEQALYAENNNDWSLFSASTTGGITTQTANLTLTSSGLQETSGSPTPLLLGNGAVGTVIVKVKYTAGSPSAIQLLTSQGLVQLPYWNPLSNTHTVSRTLTYSASGSTTAAAPLFVNAVAAVSGKVSFTSAGGATLDSYNSDPNHNGSPYQTYATALAQSHTGYSASIVSGDTIDDPTYGATVAIGNSVVYGFVVGYDYVSPSSTSVPWFSHGTNAKLWGSNHTVANKIDLSRAISTQTPYQPVFPENLPNGSGNLPASATTGGNVLNRTCTLGSTLATTPTVYYANGISLTNQTVTIQGPVTLIVYGNVSIRTNGLIQINGTRACLALFAENGTVAIGGSGGITNTNVASPYALPKRLAILSTANSGNTVTLSQSSTFCGVIYFPNCPVTVSTSATIYGSIVGSQVTVSGSPAIHYDNALRHPDALAYDPAFYYLAGESASTPGPVPVMVSNLSASVP